LIVVSVQYRCSFSLHIRLALLLRVGTDLKPLVSVAEHKVI
jgi:hypothetical protein